MKIIKCDRCGAERTVTKAESNPSYEQKSHGEASIVVTNSISGIKNTQIKFGELCEKCWEQLLKETEKFSREFANSGRDGKAMR